MATRPISDILSKWNQNSTLTAIGLNVDDTLSAANSKLLNLQVNSSSKFSVDKTGTVNANTISGSNIKVTGTLTTNALSANSFTGSLKATTVSGSSGTFTTLSGTKISGSNIKVTGTLTTNALSANSFTGSLKATTVSGSSGKFGKLTSSFAHIGAPTATSNYTHSDGSKPNLYTNKLRALTASISYLEVISGSSPFAKIPVISVNTMVMNPSDNSKIYYDGGMRIVGPAHQTDPEVPDYKEQNIFFTPNMNGESSIFIKNVGDPDVPGSPGNIHVTGDNVYLGKSSAIEIEGGKISLNPSGSDCVSINGCLSVSGALSVNGLKIGTNSLYLSSSNTESSIRGTNLTISASCLSSSRIYTNALSANSFTGSLKATTVSGSSGTFTTLSGTKISGSNIKVTGTLTTNALSANSFTGSLKATTVSGSSGKFGKLTSSFAHIGAPTVTSQYRFSDGTLPNLYTNKFKAYSSSLTYLEFITGSRPVVKLPRKKVAGNNSGLTFINFDELPPNIDPVSNKPGSFTLDPETASLFFDPPGGTGSLSGACAVTLGLFTNDYSAQYSPKYFESLSEKDKNKIRNKGRGVGLYSPCNNQFLMLDLEQIESGSGKLCAGVTTGNRTLSTTISNLIKQEFLDKNEFQEGLSKVPSVFRQSFINALSSSNNEITAKICMDYTDLSKWDYQFIWDPPGPIPTLKADLKHEFMQGENDGCQKVTVSITGPLGIQLYQEVVYAGNNCPPEPLPPGLLENEANFTHKKINADGVRFVDHKNRNLYHLSQENYSSSLSDLKFQITSSALICTKSYATIASDMGLTIPLPTYAQVSSSVFNPNYGMWKKEIKQDWDTYGAGTDIFYVDGIDISFNELNTGSLLRGIGPSGNKLKIISDNVTSNTFSSSNFNVSGGLVNVKSLFVGALTGSSGITASSAGGSSGKYAKIKIGNQTYKLLLYADV